MYKYIVTWVLLNVNVTECPDQKELDSLYGTKSYSVSCGVAHFETSEKTKNKIFDNREKAFIFYNKLEEKKQYYNFIYGGIKEIRIDSIKKTTLNK